MRAEAETAASASVVIAGGGTGGHLMPGLAVARALRARGVGGLIFIGTARGLETKLVPASGFELRLISIAGLKSGSARRRLGTIARLPGAVIESARLLRQARAQVVLGIGGYASGPVLAAAGWLRIPVVVLEVNARTGLANRLAARWVHSAAVNFASTAADFRRAQRVEVTGIPVRPEFFSATGPGIGTEPLVLVSGGSQGARGLNRIVAAMAPATSFRILHQTGAADYPALAEAYAALAPRVTATPFVEDMAAAMASAAVVVARAGASTLGELAAAGRASILVPLPNSADGHQWHNAQAFARAQAAVVMEQAQLTAEGLGQTLDGLLRDGARRQEMERAAHGLAHPGAAEAIAALVMGARKSQKKG